MSDKDNSKAVGERLVNLVDAGSVADDAPMHRRGAGAAKSAVVIGAAAALVAGGGLAGVDGAIALISSHPHLALQAAPFIGTGAGAAALATIPEAWTRHAYDGSYRGSERSGAFRSMLRRTKVRALSAGTGLALAGAGLSQVHMTGAGTTAEVLLFGATAAAGVAASSAIGQRIMKGSAAQQRERAIGE